MNARELELRKELAITHLRIARGELALARATKPSAASTTVSSAIDLATSILDQHAFGKWGRYLSVGLRVARIVLSFTRARAPALPP